MNNFAIIISAGTGPVEVRQFAALLSAELAEQCPPAGLSLLALKRPSSNRVAPIELLFTVKK